jgi:F-type H+-transporting ATPase subunit c
MVTLFCSSAAFGRVLTLSILGMALAESIAIYALILAFQGR